MKKKKSVDEDLTLNYSFAKLYEYGLRWFEIIYTCDTDHIFNFDSPVKIHSVDGFDFYTSLKHHVINLYERDYGTFIHQLQKRKKVLQTKILIELSYEVDLFKEMVVSEFNFENKIFQKFNKWQLTEGQYIPETNSKEPSLTRTELSKNSFLESLRKQRLVVNDRSPEKEIVITEEMILELAAKYAEGFIEAMDDFKARLLNTKFDLEKQSYRPKNRGSLIPESFTYIIFEGKRDTVEYKKYKQEHNISDPNTDENKIIKNLHSSLIHEVEPPFINKGTHFRNFIKLFQGKKMNVPIVWEADVTQLHYFIKSINNSKNIEINHNKHFAIGSKCFVRKNGTPYLQDELQRQKNPANTSFIDGLMHKF